MMFPKGGRHCSLNTDAGRAVKFVFQPSTGRTTEKVSAKLARDWSSFIYDLSPSNYREEWYESCLLSTGKGFMRDKAARYTLRVCEISCRTARIMNRDKPRRASQFSKYKRS